LDGNSDPYCVLKIGEGNQFSAIEKTRKIKNTKNPTWKECFTLNVNNPLTESLFLEVWNKETMTKDDSLGYAQVPLHDLQRGVEKQVWVQLEGGSTSGGGVIGAIAHLGKKKEKQNLGKVFLGLTALDFGVDPSHAAQQFGMHGQQSQQGMQGMQPGMQGMQHPSQQGMQPGIQQQGMQQGMQQQGVSQPPPTQPVVGQQGIQQSPSGKPDPAKGTLPQPGMSGQNQQGMQQQPGMQQGMQQPGMQQQGIQQPGIQQQQPGVVGQQTYQPGMQSSTHPPGMSGSDPYKQQSQSHAQDL